jgi:hypothetical protein
MIKTAEIRATGAISSRPGVASNVGGNRFQRSTPITWTHTLISF